MSTAVLFTLLASLLAVLPAGAQTAELFFSEYIEGTSNNKALEIYNGTAETVDLAAGGYNIQMAFNGSATPTLTIDLTGTVVAGDVFVLAQASATPSVLAESDQANGAGWYNGDDAVLLRRGTTTLDVIGQLGHDPGTEWGSGLTSTADNTLRRMADVCQGDPDGSDAFDPAIEWEGFATDTFDGLGTHTADCGGEPGNAAPTVTSDPANLVVDEGDTGSAAITATDPDGTVESLALTDPGSVPDGITFTSTGPDSGTLDVAGTTAPGDYVIGYTATDDEGATGTGSTAVRVVGPVEVVFIHEVQGPGDASPLVGQEVTVQAVVVGDFQDGAAGSQGDLNGFFIQEEDADADADALTSEGLFVFNGSNPAVDVAVGDLVLVTGEVSEFNGSTEINAFDSAVQVLEGDVLLPTPASPLLPASDGGYLEQFENMLVSFDQPLHVAEYFNLDRFGEMVLSSDPALMTPTQIAEPGPEANAVAAANALTTVTLDDGRSVQNPDPAPFVAPPQLDGTYTDNRRRGDTIVGLTGPLNFSFARWRVQVDVAEVSTNDFTTGRPRPADSPEVGGTLRVASFNVLNYFTTIGTVNECGPEGLSCRGASNPAEFERQTEKTITALDGLDADVVGLIEIENDGDDSSAAHLVAQLNAETGGSFDYLATGFIGTDAIKQAFIYDTSTVVPVGDFALLDSSVDPRFDDDRNRPALIQSFRELDTGAVFTAAINHLKSKGSSCAVDGDPDLGDGQGNCNLTRLAAAQALADFLATDPTDSGDPDVLVLGDLNSYAMEDPIQALEDADYSNLAAGSYGFVFDGQQGTLDYALANSSLLGQVTGAAEWHINADEADLIDYNTDFGRSIGYFNPDIPYRSSDHDPVIVGLNLVNLEPTADAGGPYLVRAGDTVQLDATGSEDPDGQLVAYAWDLDGDGEFDDAEGPTPTIRANRPPGEYEIAVMVTDHAGASAIDTATLTVITGAGTVPPKRR